MGTATVNTLTHPLAGLMQECSQTGVLIDAELISRAANAELPASPDRALVASKSLARNILSHLDSEGRLREAHTTTSLGYVTSSLTTKLLREGRARLSGAVRAPRSKVLIHLEARGFLELRGLVALSRDEKLAEMMQGDFFQRVTDEVCAILPEEHRALATRAMTKTLVFKTMYHSSPDSETIEKRVEFVCRNLQLGPDDHAGIREIINALEVVLARPLAWLRAGGNQRTNERFKLAGAHAANTFNEAVLAAHSAISGARLVSLAADQVVWEADADDAPALVRTMNAAVEGFLAAHWPGIPSSLEITLAERI